MTEITAITPVEGGTKTVKSVVKTFVKTTILLVVAAAGGMVIADQINKHKEEG
jgi:hypothetical protein